ncbi:LOW QUALITY PROTEIN: thrombopoietin receptor-like [Ammospiza maritima maritima]
MGVAPVSEVSPPLPAPSVQAIPSPPIQAVPPTASPAFLPLPAPVLETVETALPVVELLLGNDEDASPASGSAEEISSSPLPLPLAFPPPQGETVPVQDGVEDGPESAGTLGQPVAAPLSSGISSPVPASPPLLPLAVPAALPLSEAPCRYQRLPWNRWLVRARTIPDRLPQQRPRRLRLFQANTWVVLRGLEPGVRYHIYQLRSKPDGTSMDSVWGPWSQALAAETPHSSGDIGLCCRTPDLRHVRCEWGWDPAEPHSSHQLLYRPPPSGAGTREDAWQQCEEVSKGAQGTYACTFQPKAGSAISVLVNVTRTHMLPTLSYFKEPFWLHQAVLTDAPQLVQATASQGRLSLQWLPPLELPAEQQDYQVRCAMENSHDWKVLQVPRAARKEVLDLRPGSRYPAQVRAQPSGPWYRGSWSAGPKPVVVDAVADAGKGRAGGCGRRSHTADGKRRTFRHSSSDAGWLILSVTVVPLPFSAVLLGLRCTFPSLYSNMKQKLWPPVPELHRALGSFLQESSKHGQPPEETVLPCLLEVLPGPRCEAGPPPEHAGGRLSSTDIANQSYLLMSGWEPRAATTAPTPP